MNKKQIIAVGLLILFLLVPLKELRADQSMLPVQGFVLDTNSGDPLEGTYSVTFNIYGNCDDEESVYTENQSLELTNGLYGTSLEVPLDIIKESDSLCLGMQFEDDSEMSPRLEYNAAPYARLAEEAEVSQVATVALSLDDSLLTSLVGNGLDISGSTISLDTSSSQTWSGSQTYTQQVSLSTDPSDTSSSSASFRINPTTASSNEKFLAIQNNGSDRFTVDAEGDVTIAGSLSISGTLSGSGVGDITSVLPGEGLTGGGIIGAVSLSLDQDLDAEWTGNHTFNNPTTFNSDLNLTVSDDEQFSLTALLDATDINDVFSLSITNATTSGSQQGIVVKNADSTGTTESLLTMDNADTNTAVTSGIIITNSGGGGFGTLLDTPSLDISGTGALSGASGISSSGTITFSDITSCSALKTSSAGEVSCGTSNSGDITGVTAGTGLTGGGSSGDVTLNVDVGTTASKIVQLDSSAQLPAVSGANLTTLNATNISSGTLADSRLSSNVSLIGSTIESSEITDDTITSGDISADAVGSSEITGDAVGSSELASTSVTAGSYSLASITVDADGRITTASSGSASGDISTVGSCTTGDCFIDGTDNSLIFEGSTTDGFETILSAGDPTADRSITLPDAAGEISVLGQSVDSSEITNDTITTSDIASDGVGSSEIAADAVGTSEIATDGVDSAEIAADAVGSSELASTSVTAGSYSLVSITVDADGRLTSASSGSVSGDMSAVGDATSGEAFTDGANNGSKLIYEGSTIDSNETILTFNNDPDADFTVTIPNRTGTLITTGDSNSVTGGIIDESTLVLTGLVDDDDLATGAVDGGSGGEIADDSITADDIATSAVGSSEINDESVAQVDIANRTRSAFFSARQFGQSNGTNTSIAFAGTYPNRFDAWSMGTAPATAPQAIYTSWQVPQDYASGNLTFIVHYTQSTTNTNTWRCEVNFTSIADATSAQTASTTIAATITPDGSTTNHQVDTIGSDSTSVAAGDWLRINLERDSAHTEDTNTGTIQIIGLEIQYTADM